MITIETLNIYKKYQGDGDIFQRVGKKDEKKIMNYSNWRNVDDLVQKISLIKRKLASKTFEDSTIKQLKESCENQNVIDELWKIDT